jgi:hypothetical protein
LARHRARTTDTGHQAGGRPCASSAARLPDAGRCCAGTPGRRFKCRRGE